MEIKELKTKQVEELVDIKCDWCGESCYDKLRDCLLEGTADYFPSYPSKLDGDKIYFSLCEKCFFKICLFIVENGGQIGVEQQYAAYRKYMKLEEFKRYLKEADV